VAATFGVAGNVWRPALMAAATCGFGLGDQLAVSTACGLGLGLCTVDDVPPPRDEPSIGMVSAYGEERRGSRVALGGWLMALAVVMYRHLMVSTPTRSLLNGCTLRCRLFGAVRWKLYVVA